MSGTDLPSHQLQAQVLHGQDHPSSASKPTPGAPFLPVEGRSLSGLPSTYWEQPFCQNLTVKCSCQGGGMCMRRSLGC